MTKVIKSPSTIWTGSVHFADPLTMPQVHEIEKAMDLTSPEELKQFADDNGKVKKLVVDERQLPAILACVEKWEIESFPATVTLETFPATPRGQSHEFIRWLFSEIYKIYIGEIAIPNG